MFDAQCINQAFHQRESPNPKRSMCHMLHRDELAYLADTCGKSESLAFALVCKAWRNALPDDLKTDTSPLYKSTKPHPRLMWAIGCGFRPVLASAAKHGSIHMLEHIRDCCVEPSLHSRKQACITAAHNEHLNTLQWMHNAAYVFDTFTASAAALGGHLETLRWLRSIQCEWDFYTCINAAHGGHLQVLQWALGKGCRWHAHATWHAACGGHLHVLAWVDAAGYKVSNNTCDGAARNGYLDVLKWCRMKNYPWNHWTIEGAAGRGHLNVVKWACANGCTWNTFAPCAAAKGGHLHVLKWFRSTGCGWNHSSIVNAARNRNDVKILDWLAELDVSGV